MTSTNTVPGDQQDTAFSRFLFSNNNIHNTRNNDEDSNSNDLYDKCSYIPVSAISSHMPLDSLNLLSINARSLPGCIDKLKDFLADSAPDLFTAICVQEVWSARKYLTLPGYKSLSSITRDQDGMVNPCAGGGVGVFVRENVESEVLSELSEFIPGVYESIWLKLRPNKQKKAKDIIIASVYRPNSAPKANLKLALTIHTSILDKIKQDKKLRKCKLIIMSDFNLDLMEFSSNQSVSNYLDIHFSSGLLPVITKSAHLTPTSAKLIDHIFSSQLPDNYKSGIIQFDISDHMPTFLSDPSTTIAKPLKPEPFRKIDSSTIPNYLRILKTINFTINDEDPKDSFDRFFDLITTSAEIAFPLIDAKKKSRKNKNNPWITAGLKISSAKRNILFSSKSNFPSLLNKLLFSKYNNIYNKCIKKAKQLHYLSEFESTKNDIKNTWRLVNELTGRLKSTKDPLPSYFFDPDVPDTIISDPQEISDAFNSFFNNIGPNLANLIDRSALPKNNFMKFLGPKTQRKFKMHPVTNSHVLSVVEGMSSKTSHGEDFISNKLLKLAIPTLLAPLTQLINLSISTGFVPDQVKLAKVIPLFKEGSHKEFNNYRPIAVISSIGKLLEKIVHIKLSNFLESDNVLHPNQFGFRSHHSVIHPLLLFSDKILHSLDNNLLNLTIFIDLRKAFDTVNYDILLSKLSNYGIDDIWFKNYLSRSQFTFAGKTKSQVLKMICGLPQGSILAPILFLIFINDLPYATLFFTLLFADDTTFQIEGGSLQELFLNANIQLAKAQEWFASNLLTLNVKKTKFMIFGKSETTLNLPDLKIGSSVIARAGSDLEEKSIRFLGLFVDDKMNFDHHLAKLKIKLSLAIYQLSQCRYNTPLQVKISIYNSLFESNVRFGAAIFGSTSVKNLEDIFVQQKNAVRIISNSTFRAHSDPLFLKLRILKISDILKLERIIIVHKFKHGYLPSAFPHNFLLKIDPLNIGRRGDINNYTPKFPPNKLTFNHPTNLLIENWNSLPSYLKTIGSLTEFKNSFKELALASYTAECTLPSCFSCNFSPQST